MQTDHFVQTFKQQGKKLVAGQPEKCKSPEAAKSKAEKAAAYAVGVIVFAVESDILTDYYGDPVVLARHGQVPDGYMA